jgi:hypothetical protein
MATAALRREIIKFAGKLGKEAAKKKYGNDAVREAGQQMKRDAKVRAAKKAAEKPERTRKPAAVPKKQSKESMREERTEAMQARPEEAETTVLGSREKGKPVKTGVTRSQARKQISKQEGETGEQFMGRLGREAEQAGVGTGRRFSEGDSGYAREQIDDMMRGRYRSAEDTPEEPDLVDMLRSLQEKGVGGGRKKGGLVAKKKKVSGPRGTGVALRGYGKAMKGSK